MELKGRDIILYVNSEIGKDDFNAPIYEELPEIVENVLIEGNIAYSDDVVSDLQLYGRTASYILHIPKGDTHEWENVVVEFYGKKWRTFGIPVEWQEELTPLAWNKKVKVSAYE